MHPPLNYAIMSWHACASTKHWYCNYPSLALWLLLIQALQLLDRWHLKWTLASSQFTVRDFVHGMVYYLCEDSKSFPASRVVVLNRLHHLSRLAVCVPSDSSFYIWTYSGQLKVDHINTLLCDLVACWHMISYICFLKLFFCLYMLSCTVLVTLNK